MVARVATLLLRVCLPAEQPDNLMEVSFALSPAAHAAARCFRAKDWGGISQCQIVRRVEEAACVTALVHAASLRPLASSLAAADILHAAVAAAATTHTGLSVRLVSATVGKHLQGQQQQQLQDTMQKTLAGNLAQAVVAAAAAATAVLQPLDGETARQLLEILDATAARLGDASSRHFPRDAELLKCGAYVLSLLCVDSAPQPVMERYLTTAVAALQVEAGTAGGAGGAGNGNPAAPQLLCDGSTEAELETRPAAATAAHPLGIAHHLAALEALTVAVAAVASSTAAMVSSCCVAVRVLVPAASPLHSVALSPVHGCCASCTSPSALGGTAV